MLSFNENYIAKIKHFYKPIIDNWLLLLVLDILIFLIKKARNHKHYDYF